MQQHMHTSHSGLEIACEFKSPLLKFTLFGVKKFIPELGNMGWQLIAYSREAELTKVGLPRGKANCWALLCWKSSIRATKENPDVAFAW